MIKKIKFKFLTHKMIITWMALCCVALLSTSCLNQKSESSGSEERLLVENNKKSQSLTPSLKSWPALDAICNKATYSDVEGLLCKLDEILNEVAKSQKQLDDFENDIASWIQEATEIRNRVCKENKEITNLVVGTMKVLAGRNLITLPFAAPSVTSAAHIHPLVRKLIYHVAIDTVQMGCLVDKSELQKVIDFSNSPVTNPNPPSSGANPVDPRPPGNGGGPGRVNPLPPPSNGGGSTIPGNPGVSVACIRYELKHKSACEPYCRDNNSCSVAACDEILKMCKQLSCSCK